MTTKNDITNDLIKSRPNSDKFNENFERIFGKPKEKEKEAKEVKK